MDRSIVEKLFAAGDGPFVSVYLDADPTAVDAAERLAVRWKDAERELAGAGADPATVAELAARLPGPGGGATVAAIGAHRRVLLASRLPGRPAREVVTVGELPHVLPLLRVARESVGYVVALVDRIGADVLAYAGGPAGPPQGESVTGQTGYVHKTGAGGWAARRYQATVEEDWATNARAVAERVIAAAAQADAEVVVVAGDVHAVGLLRDALPPRLAERVVVVEGSRAADGGDDHVADRVLGAVGRHLSGETADLLERYARNRGRASGAVEGLPATVAALQRAGVDTLLLTEELDADRAGWFGPEPTALALDRDDLTALGVDRPRSAPLADVLVRAAVGTGADVRMVTAGVEQAPRDGAGALLRFTGSR